MSTAASIPAAKRMRLLNCLLPSHSKIALIVLHTVYSPEDQSTQKSAIHSLLRNSVLRCAADSGANFFYDLTTSSLSAGDHSQPTDAIHPDIVSGDFDSIRPEVLAFYRAHPPTRVIYTEDQNETDFTKALRIAAKEITARSLPAEAIVAFYSGTGRFDHLMAGVNTLIRAQTITNLPVFMVSGADMQCVVQPGRCELMVDVGLEGPYCGLIPLSGPTRVTTKGLKWDLSDQIMEFGELISTSNEIVADVVFIETDKPLLWTMTLKKPATDSM
ncbi:thiamin pyrophosphokinase 1-like [Paramacrobiotus metropolitanus]|uniref:thiamin pyrophosphokinase 1-like n=1 Tax=Paramacrobiotus metropolitanus TaxID=2943436 RepID=UPI0024462819|nr:thiamin pyrophosphokinase 1-like [Paramacrobiotus metropolitanus]